MQGLYDDKPIIACSSGTIGNSALAVIRLSGFEKLSNLQSLFSLDLSSLKPRYVYQSNLLDDGKVIDNIVFTYFESPRSYNGENILELSVHGNQLNVEKILSLFIDKKLARAAKPGEFTYRALLNKKLSLSQVEGLDLLLNANSSLMLQQGLETMHGELFSSYQKLHEYFLSLKASVELSIDFSEDVGEEASKKMLNESLSNISKLIESLHKRIQADSSSLNSPEIVLIGQTNAGKSSLFNKLLHNNRSIVSNLAGTTRDFVSESLLIEGTNYRLIDTAGLRKTPDPIEKEGIERSLKLIKRAFFKILVLNPFETNLENLELIDKDIELDLIVITHTDLANFEEKAKQLQILIGDTPCIKASLLEETGPIEPEHRSNGPIGPNLKSGSIGAIEKLISNKFNDLASENPILIDRHRDSINNIYESLTKFQQLISETQDIAIISSELSILGSNIEELIGVISPEDVLNNIFSNFCIGK